MRAIYFTIRAVVVVYLALLAASAGARAGDVALPALSAEQAGSLIQDVTIDAHGSTTPSVVAQYLTMRSGDVVTQSGIEHDYANLIHVARYQATLSVSGGDAPHTVRLHWNVVAKTLALTAHPYYGDKPLEAPFPGIGFIAQSHPFDRKGTGVAGVVQLSQRADVGSAVLTTPLNINARTGMQSDFVVAFSGSRGVFRQTFPPNDDIYSWTDQYNITYWLHNANDTQFVGGIRYLKSSAQAPSGFVSPSIYPTWRAPSHNAVLEAGVLHGCVSAQARWYPPYCSFQYRAEVLDAIGGFGATSTYGSITAAAAFYIRAGHSTLALQGITMRTGGVLPDSFLACSGARAYPKLFCGTDSNLLQAEYRINDAWKQPLKYVLFFDDAASRVRGQILPFPSSAFQWGDSYGVGFLYRNFIRIDIAHGKPGNRIDVGLQGQTF